jgi:hypothetical protein
MKVIVEQAPGVNLYAVSGHGRRQAIVEYLPVVIAAEDGLPADPAIHDVLPRTFVIPAGGSRHDGAHRLAA